MITRFNARSFGLHKRVPLKTNLVLSPGPPGGQCFCYRSRGWLYDDDFDKNGGTANRGGVNHGLEMFGRSDSEAPVTRRNAAFLPSFRPLPPRPPPGKHSSPDRVDGALLESYGVAGCAGCSAGLANG